ncbi:MAG: class I SAM-dependent methyltransferase [Anaerolineae bacterium]|nr:class I SAM-dependent methyltransferase [Anaerolineae bacterium]
MSTDPAYTERLIRKQSVWWKRLLDVQAPYRWHIKRLDLGITLDIGCGIGRNLVHLKNSVGIDPNESSVKIAQSRGLLAYTLDEFSKSRHFQKAYYDSFLLAHVAEHIGLTEAMNLIGSFLDLLKPNGRLVIITPQRAGYKSDPTHLEYIDLAKHQRIIDGLNFDLLKMYSFPFPALVGSVFLYNEFVSISRNSIG